MINQYNIIDDFSDLFLAL